MQGLVARLKQHYMDCAVIIDLETSQLDSQLLFQESISVICLPPKTKKQKSSTSMTNFFFCWNTLADSLQCYLDNWTMILKVCEEHHDDIDGKIAKKV